MALGAVAGALAVPLISAGASAVPGKMERMYRKSIKQDAERLAEGRGGLSEAKRQQMMAQAQGAISAQQQAQLAQLARGSAQGGASGIAQQQASSVNRGAQQATLQALSGIREQDLNLAEAQRQQLFQRMLQAQAMGSKRKAEALGYLQNVSTSGGGLAQQQTAGATKEVAGASQVLTGQG